MIVKLVLVPSYSYTSNKIGFSLLVWLSTTADVELSWISVGELVELITEDVFYY